MVNIPSSYISKLILTGNISFLSNQGSVSLLSGAIEFEGFVLISGNTAQKYESVFQISDSNQVYFEGEIMFIKNIYIHCTGFNSRERGGRGASGSWLNSKKERNDLNFVTCPLALVLATALG